MLYIKTYPYSTIFIKNTIQGVDWSHYFDFDFDFDFDFPILETIFYIFIGLIK